MSIVDQYKSHLIHTYLDPFTSIALLNGISTAPQLLIDAGVKVGPVFISYLAIMHAIRVGQSLFNNINKQYNNYYTSALHTYVSFIILSFGGTTISSILLAQTPGWLNANGPLTFYTMVFMLFQTNTLFLTILNRMGPFFQVVIAFGDGVTRGLAVSRYTVDLIKTTSQLPFITCLLCGTLSGCGGGYVYKIFDSAATKNSASPLQFNIDSVMAFVSTLVYTISVYELQVIDPSLAQGICCLGTGFIFALNEVRIAFTDSNKKSSLVGINRKSSAAKIAANSTENLVTTIDNEDSDGPGATNLRSRKTPFKNKN